MESLGAQPFIKLNNGVIMPQIGLGTYKMSSEEAKQTLKEAVMELGYRHLDTAAAYMNEEAIGEVLHACFAEGLKREEIFITTKLYPAHFADPVAAANESLKKLKLDYVD